MTEELEDEFSEPLTKAFCKKTVTAIQGHRESLVSASNVLSDTADSFERFAKLVDDEDVVELLKSGMNQLRDAAIVLRSSEMTLRNNIHITKAMETICPE